LRSPLYDKILDIYSNSLVLVLGKIANYKNGKKKDKKGKLKSLFLQDACLLEKAMDNMAKSIFAFVENDSETKKAYANEVIKIEDEQDQCRDEIITRIFGSESMVFSRADRMKIVTALDRMVGNAKQIAHHLLIYSPDDVIRELGAHLKAIGVTIAKMGNMTKTLVNQFFDDFDESIETCIKLNEARHGVRSREMEFLTALYTIKPPHFDFRYYAELVNGLTDVSNGMEHFADYIYGLIAKYSTF
jgi:predicted phosphate transport protein (TIGR00153 family)